MRLRPEDKVILLSIKIHLSPPELAELDSLILKLRNWDYFIENIIERGLAPLFYTKLPLLSNKSKLPDSVLRKLRKTYYTTLKRSINQYDELNKIVAEFNQSDIPVIALKGIYLSEWLYKDLGLRQMSDIDLLIHEEDYKKCLEIFVSLGYYSFDGDESELGGQPDLMHYKARLNEKNVYVELHIKIHQNKEKYLIPIDELWENSVSATLNSIPVTALSLTHNLIHLIVHFEKHFRNGHIQFTSVSDIVNLIITKQDEIDWEIFVDYCKKYNCLDIVCKYLMLISKYIDFQLPELILNQNVKVSDKEERKFINYLKGKNFYFTTHVSAHLIELNELQSPVLKFKHFLKVLFPSKSFLITKYNIEKSHLVVFYYIYRFYVGTKGYILTKLKKI